MLSEVVLTTFRAILLRLSDDDLAVLRGQFVALGEGREVIEVADRESERRGGS